MNDSVKSPPTDAPHSLLNNVVEAKSLLPLLSIFMEFKAEVMIWSKGICVTHALQSVYAFQISLRGKWTLPMHVEQVGNQIIHTTRYYYQKRWWMNENSASCLKKPWMYKKYENSRNHIWQTPLDARRLKSKILPGKRGNGMFTFLRQKWDKVVKTYQRENVKGWRRNGSKIPAYFRS